MDVVVALIVGVGVVVLALSPVAVGVWALVLFLRVQAHRAAAANIQGTVVESPVTVSSGGVPVPTGSGGMSFVPGGGRVGSRPVVTYYGPRGEVRTAQVRYPARQVYVYGQPVDLLVDPRNPDDVRLAAADGRARAGRLLLVSMMLALLLWGIPAVLFLVLR